MEVMEMINKSKAENHRSKNAEVVERVRLSFRGLGSYTTGELIQELIDRKTGARIVVEVEQC